MNILGLSDWRSSHDSSAALICDGALVAAAEEERFTRVKHDGSVPLSSVEFCLRQAGLHFKDVDLVAFAGLPYRTGGNSSLTECNGKFLRTAIRDGLLRKRSMLHKYFLGAYQTLARRPAPDWGLDPYVATGLGNLEERFGKLPQIRYFGHHSSHAAAAYLTSAAECAAVVSIDGQGGLFATVSWKAIGDRLKCLHAEPYTNSLGMFYLHCTQYLGLGEFGEGKTMGLASYGQPQAMGAVAERLLELEGRDWYTYRGSVNAVTAGFARRNGSPVLESPFPDFAAACQRQLQSAVQKVVKSAIQKTGATHVCLGGGVALNCSSNGALLADGGDRSISVFPASGDSGLSVGAALLCAQEAGDVHRRALDHAYWGPEFTADRCEQALRAEAGLEFVRVANVAETAAGLLADGKIIGWFQGRMEFGPRALGNRSILADPRSVAVRDRVNRLKGREHWRPLGPAVLSEHASRYFNLRAESPFMLFAAQVRPEMRAHIPGVVHVDGSARPQTVRREQNRLYYELIQAFDRKTGIPVLLNTSFNAAGEPIVCTPEDAIRTTLTTKLDALVIADFIATPRPP